MDREAEINARLEAFNRNPVAFMNEKPTKYDANGHPVAGVSLFSASTIANRRFVEARDIARQRALVAGSHGTARAAAASNDNAANLVDALRYNKLQDMENARLKQAKLAESPWSDDYWALYKGELGARYADPNFPNSENWQKNWNYIVANPAAAIVTSRSASRINRLSPSEKYDAILGDTNSTLTKRMWADGKSFYDATGSVETWMGICHGWAPAAYMLARPRRAVTLVTPDNIPIKFFPSDIKALASLLWANMPARTRFIGGRCNDKNPAMDQSTGRVISAQCFDTNPGTWHLAVVNQIGAAKRSMVFDVTFDYEVWNQPVFGYSYTYFNPQTRKATNTLSQAKVAVSAYTNDKFKRFRSPIARSVVGVSMLVSYVVETAPSQREDDSPSYDSIQQVAYEYDLELDANDVIIGGEWYRNEHPDFLWTPAKGTPAQTRYEAVASGTWDDIRRAMPVSWRTAGIQAATNDYAPLAKVVERLLAFSNGGVRAATSVAPTPSPSATNSTPSTPNASPSTPTSSANTGSRIGEWFNRILGR